MMPDRQRAPGQASIEVKESDGDDDSGPCHCRYLGSFPGVLRFFNIVLGGSILALWIPGYEHDYVDRSQIGNFRDFSRNYGAGYRSETLNQFVLISVSICLIISTGLFLLFILIAKSYINWNRLNKITHAGLTLLYLAATICASVGIWYFEENCCRVDLEWNGLGFRFKPALNQFAGYNRNNNNHCNCWLTMRVSDLERDSRTYTTILWDPQSYPTNEGGTGDDSMYVTFAAHHIQLHVAAVALMIVNTGVYALAAIFSKPKSATTE